MGEGLSWNDLRVAADFLGIDPRTLNKLLECELIAYVTIGERRKIDLAELLSFERRQRAGRKGA